jgi:hypothetical protein
MKIYLIKLVKSIIITIMTFIVFGCCRTVYISEYDDRAIRVYPAVILDLTEKQYIEKYFTVKDSYYGMHTIWINGDISIERRIINSAYRFDNNIKVTIYKDDEIILLNNININDPIRSHNFSSITDDNIISRKFHSFYGGVYLESGVEYKITVETYFGENLIEIRNFSLSIDKRE